jgi:hypothetical protein
VRDGEIVENNAMQPMVLDGRKLKIKINKNIGGELAIKG